MQAIILPSYISGNIQPPPSKSFTQRAYAASLIREGTTVLHSPGDSDDERAALGIIQALGASITSDAGKMMVVSNGVSPQSHIIDCGESALAARMFTPLAATCEKEITITGSGSLLKRPQSFFHEILPQLGVLCKSAEGFLPLRVKGPLKPRTITIDGSVSSQFLTGLLMAYSSCGANDITIRVNELKSRPYIDMTLEIMNEMGLKTPINNAYKEFYFPAQSISFLPQQVIHFSIEKDWSNAAFLLVAGAIAGEIRVTGLNIFSGQGDRMILQALMQAEANMRIRENEIEISGGELRAFHLNATDAPDLFPPLVALASCCEGISVIEGAGRLPHKESNRALTLQQEFSKMGVDITLQGNLLKVKGTKKIRSVPVNSHDDHRIAMACAVAGLKGDGELLIEKAEAVRKSYPQFWNDLQKLGAKLSLNNN